MFNRYSLWFGRIVSAPFGLIAYMIVMVGVGMKWWLCKFVEEEVNTGRQRERFVCPACGCDGVLLTEHPEVV